MSVSISGQLVTIDGRDALRFERRLPQPIERVWRAVSEPAELQQWFVGTVDWTPATGEEFTVMEQRLRITEVTPPRRLAWEWGEERYAFDLEPDGDGTRLTFTHVFVTTYGPAVQHAAGWETYLNRLGGLLSGQPITEEDAHQPMVEYHETYAAAWQADPTPGRRMIASFGFRDLDFDPATATLRLERRYQHSIERLWRALTDQAELAHWFPELQERVVTGSVEPTLLELTWWGTEILRFTLRADGEDTILHFEHRVTEQGTTARTAAGWDRAFFAFEAMLAGVPIDRDTSLEHWDVVHERYEKRLGADAAA